MSRTVVYLIGVAGSLILSPLMAGDERDNIPTITARLRVTNADGDPVSGAVVTPFGMRTKVERGSWWSWVDDRHGPRPSETTDANGIAAVQVPKFVSEKLEIGEVDWFVDHDDYVLCRNEFAVDQNPAKVVLQRGRRIAVTAVSGDTKERIDTHLNGQISDGGWSKEWNLLSGGTLLSRAVDYDRRLVRILYLPDDGPALFSEPIDLRRHGHKSRVLLKKVELHPGMRFKGMVDPQIARPVRNGHVTLRVTCKTEAGASAPELSWSDWAPVHEDGSFTFDSLPRDGVAEFIAVCDGWISAPPLKNDVLVLTGMVDLLERQSGSRTVPQLAKLSGDEIDVVVRMEPTASVQVTVQTSDGAPVHDAEVMMWPNQIWFNAGSQLVGEGARLAAILKLPDDPLKRLRNWGDQEEFRSNGVLAPSDRRYTVETGKEGVAVIKFLPGGAAEAPRIESISAEHPDYEQPVGDDGLDRYAEVELRRGKTTSITITMNPKGMEVAEE